MKHFIWFMIFMMPVLTLGGPVVRSGEYRQVQIRILSGGELAPLPEAKPLLIQLAKVIESPEVISAIATSPSLKMLRERLKTSLYHLNLKFETIVNNYPYDPPFTEPFPFRPTLEAIEEGARYLELLERTTGLQVKEAKLLRSFEYFDLLKDILASRAERRAQPVRPISKTDIIEKPVESYLAMQKRLTTFGETASFPEFRSEVRAVLRALQSKELDQFVSNDPALGILRKFAIEGLEAVKRVTGPATNLQSVFHSRFPYRRTIQAIELGLMVLDLKERSKYEEIENWHEVELSWYNGGTKKLRPLYHFNRYKYQLCGLLANNEIVVLPFGPINIPQLTRLRAAPFGLLGVTVKTNRVDRFHHTPLEEWYHDANHARRMYGYDKRKWARRKITRRDQKIAVYHEQDRFIKFLLAKTEPNSGIEEVDESRKQQRVIVFESSHETALAPDRDSLMRDLLRKPNTPQPFERQEQAHIENIEAIRTFDGNLRSGADALPLNLESPTRVIYFYDRAPGFLTNVDNKLRWGFYDSVFDIDESLSKESYRTPEFLAKAAMGLMRLMGHESTDTLPELTRQIEDRSGQPELYNYFGLDSPERGKLKQAIAPVGVQTGLRVNDEPVKSEPLAARKSKIGIFIGSFDPPHLGHKKLVEDMMRTYGLDFVYVIPDKAVSYKPDMVPYIHRKSMVETLFKSESHVRLASQQLEEKFGSGEMWEVVQAIRNEHPGAALFNIMGDDTFKWYKTLSDEKRLKDVVLLVSVRKGDIAIPGVFDGQRVYRAELNDSGYSSSSIRTQLKRGVVPRELSTATYQYTVEHALYKESPDESGDRCQVLLLGTKRAG